MLSELVREATGREVADCRVPFPYPRQVSVRGDVITRGRQEHRAPHESGPRTAAEAVEAVADRQRVAPVGEARRPRVAEVAGAAARQEVLPAVLVPFDEEASVSTTIGAPFGEEPQGIPNVEALAS